MVTASRRNCHGNLPAKQYWVVLHKNVLAMPEEWREVPVSPNISSALVYTDNGNAEKPRRITTQWEFHPVICSEIFPMWVVLQWYSARLDSHYFGKNQTSFHAMGCIPSQTHVWQPSYPRKMLAWVRNICSAAKCRNWACKHEARFQLRVTTGLK